MKSTAITLDEERAIKLQQLSESTAGYVSTVHVAGIAFDVQQRKISASAIATALLNAAIDNAHAQLPQ
jgi:predicted transcriptional regulator